MAVVHGTYDAVLPFSQPFAGALTTHALLHGMPGTIASRVATIARALECGAPFYATLGSASDPRFGRGKRFGPTTFAPMEGSERGVVHTYFDAADARTLFGAFEIESLEQVGGGRSIGHWAHDATESAEIVHWYLRATSRPKTPLD